MSDWICRLSLALLLNQQFSAQVDRICTQELVAVLSVFCTVETISYLIIHLIMVVTFDPIYTNIMTRVLLSRFSSHTMLHNSSIKIELIPIVYKTWLNILNEGCMQIMKWIPELLMMPYNWEMGVENAKSWEKCYLL